MFIIRIMAGNKIKKIFDDSKYADNMLLRQLKKLQNLFDGC